MTDRQFEDFLRERAADYHRPPEAPKEAMWVAIQEARRRERPVRRVGRGVWIGWAVGIAATLVMGIAIGRFSAGSGGPPAVLAAAADSAESSENLQAAFQWAAAQHLGRVEVFLTGFQVDSRAGRNVAYVSGDASDLLSMTRFFLDTPSTEDVQLRTLLEDVELVLAQIARYSDRGPGVERELIEDSIEQRSVMFRLRSAMTASPAGTDQQGAL